MRVIPNETTQPETQTMSSKKKACDTVVLDDQQIGACGVQAYKQVDPWPQ